MMTTLWITAIIMTVIALINAKDYRNLRRLYRFTKIEKDFYEQEVDDLNTAYVEEIEDHINTKSKAIEYRLARNYAQTRVTKLENELVKATWNKLIKRWRKFNSKNK